MNLRMLSLKKLKLVEIRIAGSSLLYSIIVNRKKVFLKKLVKGISLVFLVLQILLLEGTTLNKWFGDMLTTIL